MPRDDDDRAAGARCATSFLPALLLTSVAMWRHRRELHDLIRGDLR